MKMSDVNNQFGIDWIISGYLFFMSPNYSIVKDSSADLGG